MRHLLPGRARRAPMRTLALEVQGRRLVASCSAGPQSLSAPVVVLVHGLAQRGDAMMPLARALAPDHRVYALDLPGFGQSEGPPDGLDVPALAAAVAAWLDAMRLPRVSVAGSSTGCQVVAHLAAHHPARIARVVLESPTVDPRLRSVRRLALAWLRNLRIAPLRQAAQATLHLAAAGPRRTLRDLRRVLADRIEDALPRIDVPALVLLGARDALASRRWAAELTAHLPLGRLHVVPGAAHGLATLAPYAVAAAVHRFAREAPQRRAA